MGFLSSLASAVVKTALTPIAVVKDAASVIQGEKPEATKDLLESAGEDIDDVFE